ncbi:hypothetical protein E4T56_gene10203 [Termitomyces sp. T112]|nr:hypothetical protein E4T56_gene10203 [Termitomyces sp. T112]KAH0578437.1 hypothetical protein H2248_003585 [Termitomyces sp. 'cryptogamus']
MPNSETHHQPTGKKVMSVAKDMGDDYMKGVGEEAARTAGEKTVEYTQTDEGQQKIDDAKAEAQGLWAKYCSCFASA